MTPAPCSRMPLWLALVLAMIGAGLVSYLVEVTAFATIRGSGQIEFGALISSIGANLCIMSVAQRLSDTKVLRFPFGTFPVEFYEFGPVRFSFLQIIILVMVMFLRFCDWMGVILLKPKSPESRINTRTDYSTIH